MKLSREHIATILAFVVILILLGVAYALFYVPQIKEYQTHLSELEDLKAALKNLETQFDQTNPEALIAATKNSVQPLVEELQRRAAFFTYGDSFEIEAIPTDKILRFYYEEKYAEMMSRLDQEIYSRSPYFRYPKKFDVPEPSALAGTALQEKDVIRHFTQIRLTGELIKMFADAKALELRDYEISPPYKKGLLEMRTIGCSMVIGLDDLVKFIDKLRLSDRYFSIDAISIRNQYLAYPYEPPVEVQLLLTQASFEKASGVIDGTGEGGGGVLKINPQAMLNMKGFSPFGGGFGGNIANKQDDDEAIGWWARFKRFIGF